MRPNLFQTSLSLWPTVFRFRSGYRSSSGIPIQAIVSAFQRTMTTLIKREIISTENVKPSSTTPHHLQRYKLSLIDQLNPPTLVPIVLYFSNNNDHSSHVTTTERLKRSLSLILTRYYPLAGRINDDALSINCNDQGVPFVVAEIENGYGQNLSDLLGNPDIKLANQLLPYDYFKWDARLGPGSSVAMIQLTRFNCGGLAIGAVFWHGMMDGAAAGHFLKCWARTSLGPGYKEPVCPNYIASSLFPQSQEVQQLAVDISHEAMLRRGKSIMRRYVFDGDAISALRSQLSDNISRPSRAEATSALIMRCFMAASLANEKSRTIVIHAVNLRRRAYPPLPSDCFGNVNNGAVTSCENINNAENNLGELAEKVRASISKIDCEYVDRLAGDGGFTGLMENFKRTWSGIDCEGADFLVISSFCNFGIYDIDFGWGKPILVTLSDTSTDDEGSAYMNFVWLHDSRSGDGVEAWVTLDEKYMEIFDTTIQRLRAAAYTDRTPL